MFDINFYQKFNQLYELIQEGDKFSRKELADMLDLIRSDKPVVYNIETTNACNMRCTMCPRTTMMKRKVETMKPELFYKIIDQIEPHSESDWSRWQQFVTDKYRIEPDWLNMSENHFFLYVIPRVIQLHGYGDPLLDKNLEFYILALHNKRLQSYFSCNPANIHIQRLVAMFSCGLDYIKFSVESVDDIQHKAIRGKASDFTESFEKIQTLIYFIRKYNYNTRIIITMLNLNRENQQDDFKKLQKAFLGSGVYLYMKSEDQLWYRQDYHPTKSIHWSEPCKHPWMSMTIKSNGEAAMCMEDFNNEIILGDANNQSLYDIWNGPLYQKFRADHLDIIAHPKKWDKCLKECDMKLMSELGCV